MTPAQRKAIRTHRDRQRRQGVTRVEVQAPVGDAPLIRELAAALRGERARAGRVRAQLREALRPPSKRNFLDLLACDLPDELVDEALERPRDLGRDVRL